MHDFGKHYLGLRHCIRGICQRGICQRGLVFCGAVGVAVFGGVCALCGVGVGEEERSLWE
jgi:hypothetical protein